MQANEHQLERGATVVITLAIVDKAGAKQVAIISIVVSPDVGSDFVSVPRAAP